MATILVVDDEPDIRLLAKLNLERDGHTVRLAEDGPAALAAVAEEPPDLVVLDVMMPELDGFSVLTMLKEREPAADIPVIMLTALTGPMDRVRAGIEGAVRYLTKPIDLDDLRSAIREALACPEAPQRRAAQRGALETLARIERHGTPTELKPAPRPRLSGLERGRPQERAVVRDRGPAATVVSEEDLATLTDKQRALLDAIRGAPTVLAAADRLNMSRSNVYASLRRVGRKLGTPDVSELVRLARRGDLSR